MWVIEITSLYRNIPKDQTPSLAPIIDHIASQSEFVHQSLLNILQKEGAPTPFPKEEH
jgi:hypothetical protein